MRSVRVLERRLARSRTLRAQLFTLKAFRSNVARHAAKKLLLSRAVRKRSQTLHKTTIAAWREYMVMATAKLAQLKKAYQHCEKVILMKPALDAWLAFMELLREQEEERESRAMSLLAKFNQSLLSRMLYAWTCYALLDRVTSDPGQMKRADTHLLALRRRDAFRRCAHCLLSSIESIAKLAALCMNTGGGGISSGPGECQVCRAHEQQSSSGNTHTHTHLQVDPDCPLDVCLSQLARALAAQTALP
jgi:hypothetical protein